MIRVRSRAIRRPENKSGFGGGVRALLSPLLAPGAESARADIAHRSLCRVRSILSNSERHQRPGAQISARHTQWPPLRSCARLYQPKIIWPGGQRDSTVDNRPSWMTVPNPAPVSPAKTIKRPNPSRFQAPAPAPVVAPPASVAATKTQKRKPQINSLAIAAAERELELLANRGRSRSRGRRRGGRSRSPRYRRRRSPSSSRSRSSSSSSSSSSGQRRRSRSRSPRRNRYDTALPQAPPAANHYGPAPHRYAVPAPLRLCKHWLASGGTHCPMTARGLQCKFAHGEHELRPPEEGFAPPGEKKRRPRRRSSPRPPLDDVCKS